MILKQNTDNTEILHIFIIEENTCFCVFRNHKKEPIMSYENISFKEIFYKKNNLKNNFYRRQNLQRYYKNISFRNLYAKNRFFFIFLI